MKLGQRQWSFCILAIASLAASSATIASAVFTTVLPPPGNEASHLDIFSHYGYSSVVRIDDAADEVWYEYNGGATGKAKYAGHTHQVGYSQGLSGETNTHFENTKDTKFDVYVDNTPQTLVINFTPNDYFRFRMKDLNTNTTYSSVVGENVDSKDHMVTYKITGGADAGDYLIFWEDLRHGDWDYNDMVLQVHGMRPNTIPEPSTFFLLGAGLAVPAFIRMRKRRTS